MREDLKPYKFLIIIIFLLTVLACPLLMSSTPFLQVASARTREFEENITIPSNDLASLELVFSSGDELELIFLMEVKQDLPIDIWFVNYANYIRLVDGNEFLYFIDGSEQEVKQAQKVVTLTQHNSYSLVLANYNNQSVDVYLTYDINIYPQEEDNRKETPLWKEPYVILPLGLIIGILVGLFASRIADRAGKRSPKAVAKSSYKKAKARNPKKTKPRAIKKTPSKKAKDSEAKKEETVVPKKTLTKEIEEPRAVEKTHSPRFCGHCGKPVTTPFCKYCGRKV